MTQLNLPLTHFKTRLSENNVLEVWDMVRRKYVRLTPEEEVRQRFVHFLIFEKKYIQSLMSVEKTLKVNGKIKRTDIVQYHKNGSPILIVECKAPQIKITQDVFYQAAIYNLQMQVKYLILTNGINHYCCKLNYQNNSFDFLEDIPNYDDL